MLLLVLSLVAGLALLTWSAQRFVEGAAALATNLGLAPLVVGIVVLGFGTSAPELLISSVAAWEGSPGVSIGNALGSNISNIALILGVVALIGPLVFHDGTVRRELPVLFLATALGQVLLADGVLDRRDGALLCGALLVAMAVLVIAAMRARRRRRLDDAALGIETLETLPTSRATELLILGLGGLLLSAKLLVDGAGGIARHYGISELVIGLTVVAIGTSLPELAASYAAALKQEHELAIGNVIGSNLFNTLAVMGLPGIIFPSPLPDADAVLGRDYPIMVALTVALLPIAIVARVRPGWHRATGVLLLVAFVAYEVVLIRAARG